MANMNSRNPIDDLISASIMAAMFGNGAKKPETNEDAFPAKVEPKEAASKARAFYNAYLDAGFTVDQSFDLTKISMNN